jgi:hypothetical protein
MGIAPIGLVLSKIANPQGAAAAVLGASGGTAQAPTDKYSARVDLRGPLSYHTGSFCSSLDADVLRPPNANARQL